MNNTLLEEVTEIKDLGVCSDSLLVLTNIYVKNKQSLHDVGYNYFVYISRKCFVTLYKSLVRYHLENANSV